ncbi:MAG: hypothetical protein J6Y29_02580 [Clostridiales bacterium]|nr:hypothetical protein [Clostridiales bacterium]
MEDEKRIIRIQDLKSNYIEEMIVILKNNSRRKSEKNPFIVREAERILDDYVLGTLSKYLHKKHKRFRIDLNRILNYLLVLSAVAVCYMVVYILRR